MDRSAKPSHIRTAAATRVPDLASSTPLEDLDADAFMRGDFLADVADSSVLGDATTGFTKLNGSSHGKPNGHGSESASDASDGSEDSAAPDSETGNAGSHEEPLLNDAATAHSSNVDDDNSSESEDEAEEHAHELAALSAKDPEFYQYLQKEEPDLLAFDPAELEVSIGILGSTMRSHC